jgi:hypothetical protein
MYFSLGQASFASLLGAIPPYDFGAAGFGLGMSNVQAPPKQKVVPKV